MAHRLAASEIFVKVGGSNLSSAFFCRSIGDELTPCDQDGRQEWKGVHPFVQEPITPVSVELMFANVSTLPENKNASSGEGSSGVTCRGL